MQKKKKEMASRKKGKNQEFKKKKIFLKQIEESSLEGLIEEGKITESDVSEFRASPIFVESRAPVLERIRNPVQIKEERNIPQANEVQKRRVNYAPVSNEPKYSAIANSVEREEKKYESSFIPPVLARRNMQTSERQNFLRQTDKSWMDNANNLSIDTDSPETHAGLPFENEQKKYRRFKIR